MITVTIGESKPQEEKPFPKLMKYNKKTFIVLFQSPTNGMVVWANSDRSVGEIESDWDIHSFTEFNEPITIQNK